MMILITAIIGVITSAIGIGIMRPVSVLLGADEAMLPKLHSLRAYYDGF